jgi:2-methylisocitrate lyase-like PEP mutase family enzyme
MSNTTTVADKASVFVDLHTKGPVFIIPNPWDAGSARVLEEAGFSALARLKEAANTLAGGHFNW